MVDSVPSGGSVLAISAPPMAVYAYGAVPRMENTGYVLFVRH